MPFKINDAVRWTSSYLPKEGVIVAVVPPDTHPAKIGFPLIGKGSMSRSAESYIVRGGEPGRRPAEYWPLVSALHSADGLTTDELAWCRRNASAVRAFIQSQ